MTKTAVKLLRFQGKHNRKERFNEECWEAKHGKSKKDNEFTELLQELEKRCKEICTHIL